jgi:hypothetical protein
MADEQPRRLHSESSLSVPTSPKEYRRPEGRMSRRPSAERVRDSVAHERSPLLAFNTRARVHIPGTAIPSIPKSRSQQSFQRHESTASQ